MFNTKKLSYHTSSFFLLPSASSSATIALPGGNTLRIQTRKFAVKWALRTRQRTGESREETGWHKSRSTTIGKKNAAPASAIPAPMYMGFRTKRYGPRITSRRGGSNGAGVPLPMNAKVNTHQSAIAAPIVPIIIPATCGAPMTAGRTMPDQAKNRAGK